jgi:hypothetical protein
MWRHTAFPFAPTQQSGQDSTVGIADRYQLDGPWIEYRSGLDFPHAARPALGFTSCAMNTGWPRRGVEHPPFLVPKKKKDYSDSSPLLNFHGQS